MDFFHLCRFCLNSSCYHSNIFTETVSSVHFYRLINNIFDVKVSRNDGLPEYVCMDCFQTITKFWYLKTQAKKAETTLMMMKRNVNMVTIKEEIVENPLPDELSSPMEAVKVEMFAPSRDEEVIISYKKDKRRSEEICSVVTIKEEIVENPLRNELSCPMEAVKVEMSASSRDEDMVISSKKDKRRSEEICSLEEVSAIYSDGNASLEEQKSISQEDLVKQEIVTDEMIVAGEENRFGKIIKKEVIHSKENATEDDVMDVPSGTFSEVSRTEWYHCREQRETNHEIEDAHNSIFNEDNTPIQQQIEDTNHTCSMCERRFKNKSALARHMLIHTVEKPFQCNVCNYSCCRSGDLKVHMRKHTGEKPFQCNICNYTCSHSGRLKVHMRKHTGEKPFQCSICNYSCPKSGDLKVHMRKHSGEKPYQCNICDYSCSQGGRLKVHLRKHSGEKPFHCTICNYSCLRNGSLKSHMRTHTGEKPFQCNVCDYSCSQSGPLKGHMLKHSEEILYPREGFKFGI